MSFRKILIAVDGEPLADHAAEVGIELASSLGAEIGLVYVVEPALSQAPGIQPADLIAEDEREGRRVLDRLRHLLPPDRLRAEFIHAGRPASEIVRTAKEWAADVIVIGSHGRHGFQRALLGSVAEEVMRHAPCPVLVLRAKE